MVEYYYRSLHQVYSIIIIEIPCIQPNLVLQIAFKAINNSLSSNELVLILLDFDFYF